MPVPTSPFAGLRLPGMTADACPGEAMSEATDTLRADRIKGCLLGLALGDALGLPFEGLGPARIRMGEDFGHRFFLGRGLFSDDTEHACMTAQALLASGGDPQRFATSLAWRLRGWFLGLPAGVGLATLRACLRLWCFVPPDRAGVFSAGNGPAMRSPILGAALTAEDDRLRLLVRASTRLTHTDPLAEEGAWLLALACRHAAHRTGPLEPGAILDRLQTETTLPPLVRMLTDLRVALDQGLTPEAFGRAQGWDRGVSGYIVHTLGAALMAWLSSPEDFPRVLRATLALGGDTDTTAAIAGALAGATVGHQALPEPWLQGLADWPRSRAWVETLAQRLVEGPPRPLRLFWPALLPRNLAFLGIVLGHGFRRLVVASLFQPPGP